MSAPMQMVPSSAAQPDGSRCWKLTPKPCSNCGEPATGQRYYRDVCPTDRGDEIREGYEPICDECEAE